MDTLRWIPPGKRNPASASTLDRADFVNSSETKNTAIEVTPQQAMKPNRSPFDLLAALDLPAPAAIPRKPRGRPGPISASGRAKKGGRVEREIVALIRDLGIDCRKVPLSGALAKRLGPDFAGDVKAWVFGPDNEPLTLEVKARAGGAGFATLERWLGSCDALVLKRNGAPPMVALPWHVWARIVTKEAAR